MPTAPPQAPQQNQPRQTGTGVPLGSSSLAKPPAAAGWGLARAEPRPALVPARALNGGAQCTCSPDATSSLPFCSPECPRSFGRAAGECWGHACDGLGSTLGGGHPWDGAGVNPGMGWGHCWDGVTAGMGLGSPLAQAGCELQTDVLARCCSGFGYRCGAGLPVRGWAGRGDRGDTGTEGTGRDARPALQWRR